MNRQLSIWALLFVLAACEAHTKPYIQHEVAIKRLGASCAAKSDGIHMESNTVGERYVFQACLNEGFTKKDVRVSRNGDSVVVALTGAGTGGSLYELTLDIDTYPAYHFLTLGNQTLQIVPAAP